MTLSAAASVFLTSLLSVQVIQGSEVWGATYRSTQICAVKGSTVEIRCSFWFPSRINYKKTTVEKTLWFKMDGDDPVELTSAPQYSGRVSQSCEDQSCTLTLRDVTESDSAHLQFRFITNQEDGRYTGKPGVNLTVTELQVQLVEASFFSYWRKLRCQSSCLLPDPLSYIWYKNGERIPSQTSSHYLDYLYSTDSFSCAVEGHENFPSPSVYGPRPPSVTVSPSGEIVEGSSVTLTCSSDANPAAKYTWYKKNGNVNPVRTGPQLVFSSIQSSDSGQYYCRAENKLGRRTSEHTSIHVRYGPKPPSVSVSPSGEIVEGSSVTLTCSSDANPAAKYTWYKENGTLNPVRTGPQLVLSSIQSSDSGQYYCRAENKLGRRTSEHTSIHVRYAPRPPSVSVSPSGEIVEGSSVTLTCSSDANPAAKYTWYKENQQVLQGPTIIYQSISSEDRGAYYCQADNQYGRVNSSSLLIDVQYAPKPPSVSVSPSGEIVEGSSVTLTCSSDANPAAKYTWYKENGTLNPVRTGPQLVFSSIQSSDSGQYYCRAENKLGRRTSEHTSIHVRYGPRPPSVSVSPSGEIVEGSSVTLTCSSDANPAANYTWYKENQQVLQGPTIIYESISSEDRGAYYCQADNQYGRVNSSSLLIDVQYAPKPPSVSASSSGEIVEGSSVTLTCSSDANPAAKYTWYKENGTLNPVRTGPQLVLSSIQSSDSGQYYCRAENKLGRRTSEHTSIHVRYAPRPPSVSVSPSGEIAEGSSVTLTCSSDANPAAKYTWYKENQQVLQGPTIIYESISSEDRGVYYCQADNQYGRVNSSSLLLDVQYAPQPPSVSVSPSGEIVEGSSVTLTCSSDANPAAKYTWYKENGTLNPVRTGPQLVFSSIQSSDSGQYYCRAENKLGRRTSEHTSIQVRYAPKPPSVSVSSSGEIVEGSSVTLTCSSDANPAANYTWYKENEDSPKASGQNFTITDFRAEHSGNYYCEAQNERGRSHSTFLLVVVAGQFLYDTITNYAAVLSVIFLSAFLIIRRKTSSKQTTEQHDNKEQVNMDSAAEPRRPPEEDGDLYYSSVAFVKKQEDPLYSNIRSAQLDRSNTEDKEDDSVEYSVVKFQHVDASPQSEHQDDAEDPSALYSKVTKQPRTRNRNGNL
ncbi:uncharacterized protein V6R79_004642 [Siganus canaliculatus]